LIESTFLQSADEVFSLWRTNAQGIPRISGHLEFASPDGPEYVSGAPHALHEGMLRDVYGQEHRTLFP
jgi:hypothetical protein